MKLICKKKIFHYIKGFNISFFYPFIKKKMPHYYGTQYTVKGDSRTFYAPSEFGDSVNIYNHNGTYYFETPHIGLHTGACPTLKNYNCQNTSQSTSTSKKMVILVALSKHLTVNNIHVQIPFSSNPKMNL